VSYGGTMIRRGVKRYFLESNAEKEGERDVRGDREEMESQ